MHEYGMVESLLSAVDESVRSNGGTRAVRVVVSVGALGGIDERLLRDAFDDHKAASSASGAELSVEYRPADTVCPKCGSAQRIIDVGDQTCPECGGPLFVSARNADVYLTSVELEA